MVWQERGQNDFEERRLRNLHRTRQSRLPPPSARGSKVPQGSERHRCDVARRCSTLKVPLRTAGLVEALPWHAQAETQKFRTSTRYDGVRCALKWMAFVQMHSLHAKRNLWMGCDVAPITQCRHLLLSSRISKSVFAFLVSLGNADMVEQSQTPNSQTVALAFPVLRPAHALRCPSVSSAWVRMRELVA